MRVKDSDGEVVSARAIHPNHKSEGKQTRGAMTWKKSAYERTTNYGEKNQK